MDLRANLAAMRHHGSAEDADRLEREWTERGLLGPAHASPGSQAAHRAQARFTLPVFPPEEEDSEVSLGAVSANPPGRLTLVVAPGAESWAPSDATVATLGSWLTEPATIRLYPRASIADVWKETTNLPVPVSQNGGGSTYFARGWAQTKPGSLRVANLFVDDTETRDSLLWGILHELAHLDMPSSALLVFAYRSQPKSDDYHKDDDAHEANEEEQMANFVADRLGPMLGIATGYDRRWWRTRVKAKLEKGTA